MRIAYLLMMHFLQRYSFILFFILLTVFHLTGSAQCISNFPYTQDFENSNGNWTTGGTASDWTWGTPAKAVIKTAGNGKKCWIAGGLTGNYYNTNERSWLQSQCFNFSTIKDPYISFLVNWDTEINYDGAALQYTTDYGVTWISAGEFEKDRSNDCKNAYWYNNPNIQYGFQSAGWSGSASSGSQGWVTAYHSFPQLAGISDVIFRFVFGAGDKFNDFNGFAFDDIYVGETPIEQLAFVYTCTSTPAEASFAMQTSGCTIASTLQWNFGDLQSGAANVSAGNNVLHRFSSPGFYEVTLTGKNNSNETVSGVSQTIIIPAITATVTSPIACYGATGLAEASVTNTNAQVSFSWSTDPVITTSAAQLKAGSYLVTASVIGGCPSSKPVTLTQPGALNHNIQTVPADCNNLNGKIAIEEDGGTPPYRYAWQGIQYSTSSADNLPAGNYSILVTDANACTDKADVSLSMTASTLSQTFETGVPDCGMLNGFIKVNTTGGASGYTYQWTPDVSITNTASNIAPGSYTVVATDMNQCRATGKIVLPGKPLVVSLGNDTFVCKGQTLLLKPSGNYAAYLWNDGSSASIKPVEKEGYYSVTVTNNGGCKARDTVHISVGCGDLLFPSVFTPNGDGLNEQFGPSGGLSLVSSYRLLVYNRFGNLVFQSVNPYQKWKGDMNGKKLTGTYTYMVMYNYEGERKIKKGTIVLFL